MPGCKKLPRSRSSCYKPCPKPTFTSKTRTLAFPCHPRKPHCRVRKSNPRNLCLDSLRLPCARLDIHKRLCRRSLLCPVDSQQAPVPQTCRRRWKLEPCPLSRPICPFNELHHDCGSSCSRNDVCESPCEQAIQGVESDFEPGIGECLQTENVEGFPECCTLPEPCASSTPYKPCCHPQSPPACLKPPPCVSEDQIPICYRKKCVSIETTPSCSKRQLIPCPKPSGCSVPIRSCQESICCQTPPICPACEESSCQTGHIACETGMRKHMKNSTGSRTICPLYPPIDSCCGTFEDSSANACEGTACCKYRILSKTCKDKSCKDEEKRFKKEEKARKKAEKKARKNYEKERKKALKRRKSGKDNFSSDSMFDSSYSSTCSSCCNSSESKVSKKEEKRLKKEAKKREKARKKGQSQECSLQGMCESVNNSSNPCDCSEDNACSCIFPPAYQQFSCMGNINGSCNCKSCPSEK